MIKRIPLLFCILISSLFSCRNAANHDLSAAPSNSYLPPTVEQLRFSKPVKINWADVPVRHAKPEVQKLDLDHLPSVPYDTAGFKPFEKPVDVLPFDIDNLPHQPWDISAVPSRPIRFKTTRLPPPTLVKTGPRRLKHADNLMVYDIPEINQPASSTYTDAAGFTWIATAKNLYRYDGHSLQNFMSIPVGNPIMSICEDSKGRLWLIQIGTKLFQVIDPKNGTLLETDLKSSYSINKDDQHHLWISGTGEPFIYEVDVRNDTYRTLGKKQGLLNNSFLNIVRDQQGRLWLSCDDGTYIIDERNKQLIYRHTEDREKKIGLSPFLCDPKGRLWFSGDNGLLRVVDLRSKSEQRIHEMEPQSGYGSNPAVDVSGRVYFAQGGQGLKVIDLDHRKILHLTTMNGLTDNFVTGVQVDSTGQTWITTNYGLNILADTRSKQDQIGSEQISSMTEDERGMIWAGYELRGIDLINRKDHTVKHLPGRYFGSDSIEYINQYQGQVMIATTAGCDIISPDRRTIEHFSTRNGLGSPVVISCFIDSKKRIWFGLDNGAIELYDPADGSVRTLGQKQGINVPSYIMHFFEDNAGRIWYFPQEGKVGIVDLRQNQIQTLESVPGNGYKIACNGDDGSLWVGTRDGVYVVRSESRQVLHLTAKQGLIGNDVLSINRHGKTFYAATASGISAITPANGHFDISSYEIPIHSKRDLLLDAITHDGFFCWGGAGIHIFDFSKKDSTQTIPYVSATDVMGERQYFTKTSSNGLKWDSVGGPGYMPLNLHLPFNQNYLHFSYSSKDLNPSENVLYRYLLVGHDQQWSEPASETDSKNYFNLEPDQYTFEVSAKNHNGSWSKPAVLSFVIDPPWWATWWGRTFFVILLIALVWMIVYYQSRRLVQSKKLLEEKVRLRTAEVLEQKEEIQSTLEELQSTQAQLVQREKMASLGELTAGIAHEIQNPLNFVNNFSEVSTEMMAELKDELQKGDVKEAMVIVADIEQNLGKIYHHGRRADSIVKGMLEHSRTSTGQREPTDLNKLADEYLRLAYHGLRAKDKNFNAELVTHYDDKISEVNVVAQDIGRVLLNIINNAFYATQQKAKTAGADYKPIIAITTLQRNNSAIISIKDNGTGIPENIREKIMQPFFTTKPTGEGTGLGLSLSYDIVNAHGGKIDIASTPGAGSTFTISLSNN